MVFKHPCVHMCRVALFISQEPYVQFKLHNTSLVMQIDLNFFFFAMQAMSRITSFNEGKYAASECVKQIRENVHCPFCLKIFDNTPI